jgi:diaminopimelate decarboxylase
VSLRLNPDVDAGTHAYITTGRHDTKFGVDLQQAGAVVDAIVAAPELQLCGYHVHLGSQLLGIEPWLRAFDRVAAFLDGAPARRTGVSHYDLGGGFGIGYGRGGPLDVGALASALLPRLRARGLRPMLEPGRYLVGDAGVLVTTVLGRKRAGATAFVLVDAAMNDLLRPALYGAEHPMAPVLEQGRPEERVDVVGPVCESADFLARARLLPGLRDGERLAVLGAGAYGAAMACNYNSRRRPAEVLVDGGSARLIRRRETFAELWAGEVDPS